MTPDRRGGLIRLTTWVVRVSLVICGLFGVVVGVAVIVQVVVALATTQREGGALAAAMIVPIGILGVAAGVVGVIYGFVIEVGQRNPHGAPVVEGVPLGRAGRQAGIDRGSDEAVPAADGRTDEMVVTSAALRFISRLMPPMAGERWLAEANSLLFEAGETRRAMLSRHYLLSAPRVVATMWLLEASRGVRLSRRTRKGPRTRDGRRTGEGRRHGPPEQR